MIILDLFIKNRFSKFWAVSSIFDLYSSQISSSSILRDKNFFLWLGRMGYQKIRLFILISKMYGTYDLSKKCTQKKF